MSGRDDAWAPEVKSGPQRFRCSRLPENAMTSPNTKRSVRARVREVRLREHGYDSYAAYLSSPAWRDLKARYRESDLPQICMCGETKVQLHHTTYERVGRERLDDLIPLCHDCHTTAHALEAAGIIELDLQGFYYDAERAAANAAVEEARKAAIEADRDYRTGYRQRKRLERRERLFGR